MKWSEREICALKKLYPLYIMGKIPRDEMETCFRRTVVAIQHKAHIIGIAKKATVGELDVGYYKQILKRYKL